MLSRLRYGAWMLGYLLVCGEALWLFLSLLTLVAASLLSAGTDSALLARNVAYLATGLSFLAHSLLPGVVLGFILLLFHPFRDEDEALWLPAALVIIPLTGVVQSAVLTSLLYSIRHQGSPVVWGASIFWLVAIIAILTVLARKKAILYAAAGAIVIGLVWGAWMFQII